MNIRFNLDTELVEKLAIGLIVDQEEDWRVHQNELTNNCETVSVSKRDPPTLAEYFFFLKDHASE